LFFFPTHFLSSTIQVSLSSSSRAHTSDLTPFSLTMYYNKQDGINTYSHSGFLRSHTALVQPPLPSPEQTDLFDVRRRYLRACFSPLSDDTIDPTPHYLARTPSTHSEDLQVISLSFFSFPRWRLPSSFPLPLAYTFQSFPEEAKDLIAPFLDGCHPRFVYSYPLSSPPRTGPPPPLPLTEPDRGDIQADLTNLTTTFLLSLFFFRTPSSGGPFETANGRHAKFYVALCFLVRIKPIFPLPSWWGGSSLPKITLVCFCWFL